MRETQSELPRLDIQALPGPETIQRRELDNGIVVLARENFASPTVVLTGYVLAGSLNEKPEHAGLADLTIASLMRGTQTRNFQEIYESIESIGATLSLGAGKHYSSFLGKGLVEDFNLLLNLLADVLRAPSFPAVEVERLRAEKLTALAERDQNTGSRAHLAFGELAYPEHPYRLPTTGYVDTIKSLTIPDLRRFHRNHIGPRGAVISVVGALDVEVALDTVEAHFQDWTNPNSKEPPTLPLIEPPTEIVRKNEYLAGKIQCDLVIGVPGPSRFEPQYLAAALGNNILGRFGLFGRIGDSVRETAGLAYYAYSALSGGPGPGSWRVIAGVNPANVERALSLIRHEIRQFSAQQVTEEELTDNQAHFIGRLPLQLETNAGVAGALVHLERYGLGLDYYQRYPHLIASISRDQILSMAERFLDADRLAIGVAGPKLEES